MSAEAALFRAQQKIPNARDAMGAFAYGGAEESMHETCG
jgi:hypothetical protein